MAKRVSKPLCAYCGKAYGRRDIKHVIFYVEIGKPIPGPHTQSNHPMIKEDMHPPLPENGGPATPEEADSFVMMDPSDGVFAPYKGRKGRRITREFWDGETYKSGYDPFCTLVCSLHFARACYDAGMRMETKEVLDQKIS